ncbi:protein unc-93 homolog A-like [Xyrauchen texanus]|uniref:protein unc-93 homolog A-like n=1 Tax=Xyrauchen texanus TaxID=154827 RepID=UPI0022427057|nr:protein unc-93 homolog A-like [Xyrauchen texanus]
MITHDTKNVLVVSFGFLLLFTAYGGLQSLQSSLNAEDGMGVISISVIYGAIILSSMFLPPIMIKNLGCKWTIVISMGCYVAYSFGNLSPGWASLMSTSAILGFGGSPLWSAKCTYLTISANKQGQKLNKKSQDIINQYFGVFFFIFQTSTVWGNLMSSLIFGQDSNIAEIPEENLQYCGAGLCIENFTTTGNTTRPEKRLVDILLGCYIGVGLLAIIFVALFLDNIDRDLAREFRKNKGNVSFCSTILSTFKLMRNPKLLLLIPLTIYSGFEQSFLDGEYTKNYVTCALGIHYVGFVMICFGAVNSLCSFAFGRLAAYTGRIPLFCLAALINLGCILGLLYWKPHPDQLPVFFVFSALWGMADAVWQIQTNALYGILFADHKEAAFANYRMWESLGFVIAFAYSTYICLSTKIYIILTLLAVTMVTYLFVEYKEYKQPTEQMIYVFNSEKTDLKDEKYVKIRENLNEKYVVSQTHF